MSENLIERIDKYLSRSETKPVTQDKPNVSEGLVTELELETVTPEQDAEAANLKAALSGAFNEAINIYAGTGVDAGSYLAEIPIPHLRACGIRMIESIIPPRVGGRDIGTRSQAVTGSVEALLNAERRVAKPLGEGWKVKADSFFAHTTAKPGVLFRITKA